jgi:hypothetical protein
MGGLTGKNTVVLVYGGILFHSAAASLLCAVRRTVKVTAFGMELVPKGKSGVGGVLSGVAGFFKNVFGGGSKGPR